MPRSFNDGSHDVSCPFKRLKSSVSKFIDDEAADASDDEELDEANESEEWDDEDTEPPVLNSPTATVPSAEHRARNTPSIFQEIIDMHERRALTSCLPVATTSSPPLTSSASANASTPSPQPVRPANLAASVSKPPPTPSGFQHDESWYKDLAEALLLHPDQRFLAKYPIFHVKCQVGIFLVTFSFDFLIFFFFVRAAKTSLS